MARVRAAHRRARGRVDRRRRPWRDQPGHRVPRAGIAARPDPGLRTGLRRAQRPGVRRRAMVVVTPERRAVDNSEAMKAILGLLLTILAVTPAVAQEQPRMGGVLKAAMIGEPPGLDLHTT